MLFLLLSVSVQAAGNLHPNQEPRSLSRGGADVAGSAGIEALLSNPAGLSHLEGLEVQLDAHGGFTKLFFARAAEAEAGVGCEDLCFPLATSETLRASLPSLSVGLPLPWAPLALGLGFHSPYTSDIEFPDRGSQRYTVQSLQTRFQQIDGSLSFQPFDFLRVALGLSLGRVQLAQELAATVYLDPSMTNRPPALFVDDPDYDVALRLEMDSRLLPSWHGGVQIGSPEAWWGLGIDYRQGGEFQLSGEAEVDMSEHALFTGAVQGIPPILVESTFGDDDVRMLLTMASQWRVGGIVRPHSRLAVELTLARQLWSAHTQRQVEDIDLHVDSLVGLGTDIEGSITQPTALEDSWSLHLGGEFQVSDRVGIRLGGFAEQSAVPRSVMDASIIDGDKLGYGAGGSLAVTENLEWSLAFSQSITRTVEVEESETQSVLIHAVLGDIQTGKTVARGDYQARHIYFSTGLTWRLGGA